MALFQLATVMQFKRKLETCLGLGKLNVTLVFVFLLCGARIHHSSELNIHCRIKAEY